MAHYRSVYAVIALVGARLKRSVRRRNLCLLAAIPALTMFACSRGGTHALTGADRPRVTTAKTAIPALGLGHRLDAYYASHPEAVAVTEDVVKPELLENGASSLECLQGKQVALGVHVFAITVDRDGSVRDPQYLSERDVNVGNCYLPQLKRWRYRPATKDGRSVPSVLVITLNLDG